MTLRYYPAVLEKSADGYCVWFPDFDGCVSAGDTVEHAAAMAEEALGLHIGGMLEDGDAIPSPSLLENLTGQASGREFARILVRAELPGRSVRLNISLDEGLLGRIDAAAKRAGVSRSAYLAAAVRRQLRDDARQ